jgi:sulfide dehydrogenase cytochrome subunit
VLATFKGQYALRSGPPPAHAANDDLAAQRLAANCTGCHGPAGASAGAIPSIAGLEQDYFSAAMRAFRDGSRQATVMHQHAKGYDDREIDLLAKYFSSQKRP